MRNLCLRFEENTLKKYVAIILILIHTVAGAQDSLPRDITIFKNPDCSCCNKWIKYLRKFDYNITVVSTRKLLSEKARLKIPPEISSCHTSVIGGYVVEGHVTHRDITRLLLFKPDVLGIAVPGMPIGTPGMERGNTVESYDVLTFDKDGNVEVFVKH